MACQALLFESRHTHLKSSSVSVLAETCLRSGSFSAAGAGVEVEVDDEEEEELEGVGVTDVGLGGWSGTSR